MPFLPPPGLAADLAAAAPIYRSGNSANDTLDAALKIVEKRPPCHCGQNFPEMGQKACFGPEHRHLW
jgi:hypothetical protein